MTPAERLHALAKKAITGDIPVIEYHIAAREIDRLETLLETAMATLGQIAATPRNRGAKRNASATLIFIKTQKDVSTKPYIDFGGMGQT